jgi:hypothetical protein
MAVRLSALRTSRTLHPRNIIILMLLVLISVRGWVNPRASYTSQDLTNVPVNIYVLRNSKYFKYFKIFYADTWGAMLQARKSGVRDPMRSLNIFGLPNPSSRIMALGFTQPLTEMSTRKSFCGYSATCVQVWHNYRHLWADFVDNVGSLIYHSPIGLLGSLQG